MVTPTLLTNRCAPWRQRTVVLLVALALSATACSSNTVSGQRPSQSATAAPADETTVAATGTDSNTPSEPAAVSDASAALPTTTAVAVASGLRSVDELTTAGGSVEVDGDIAVPVGQGELVLRDVDLDVHLDADGELGTQTGGTATLELPTTGPLAGAFVDRALRGRIGVALGSELQALGAHLRPERRYLYADVGSQEYDLFLDLDEHYAGTQGLPAQISSDGDAGATMLVADLEGDYFYLSTPCAALVPADGGKKQRPESRRDNPHADDDASEIPGVSADLSGFDPGGCGIGWSTGGLIPFTPILDKRLVDIPRDFGSHLVVDGTVPVATGASLDGEMFYRFENERASVWANGELDIGLTFLKGAAEVTLPAVRGTFGLEMTSRDIDLWVTATAGSSATEGTSAALLADIAPIRGQVDVDGELHITDGAVEPSSFLQLSGNVNIAPTTIRAGGTTEVQDLVAADALVRIDSTGVLARGSVQVSPLAGLAVTGTAALEFKVPFAEPADSYLQVEGSLGIGSTALGAEAELRIDRAGAHARGSVELAGLGSLDVEGWLGADGFQLTGSVEATLPIGDLDKVAAKLVDQTSNAAVIKLLNSEIDERVEAIARRDAQKGTELRNTVRDMRNAFATIASTRETIAYNDGLIADLWKEHQADIDWHWALNDIDRAFDKIPHGVRLGAILVRIEGLKAANSLQYLYIDGANTVIAGAQQLALGFVGWDAELNALVALQTEAYLSTLAGNFVATVLNGVDAVLDAFGVDGSATGTVTFTVGTQGVGATAELAWCRDGSCTPLAGATVALAPYAEVCAQFVGVPTCVRL